MTKSAVSRRFVALSAERMKEWMAADLSKLDLLVIQIDGIHIKEDLMLLAAVGIDGDGRKHPLGVIEGATENAAVVQALLDNLVGRGLDPAICRLFIIDGAKALSKAIRNTFGRHTPIQRCQVHKARNITERLAKPLHASVRKALRQAWELDDADKAEKLIRNLARRLDARSTISPLYTMRPAPTGRPSRSSSARWRSLRRRSAPSIPTPPSRSAISPSYTMRPAPTPRPSRSTNAPWRSLRRRSAPSILTLRSRSTISHNAPRRSSLYRARAVHR